jgi:hypothetical protein
MYTVLANPTQIALSNLRKRPFLSAQDRRLTEGCFKNIYKRYAQISFATPDISRQL